MWKEFAPGLPSKTTFATIDQNGKTRLVIQEHNATNKHFDMRLKGPGGVAHSWVIRDLPGKRDKMLAIQQPTHTAKYMDFEGTIESGYGAGDVKKVYDEKIKVISANNDKIKMKLPQGIFTMIRPKGFDDKKHWLMIKNAFIQDRSKQKYKTVKEIDYKNEGKALQPKVDGANTVFELNYIGPNSVYSHRSRKGTGEPIEHTDQVPNIRDLEIPKSLSGTVLRGELYGKSTSGPMPAEQVGGILNSGVEKSLEKQRKLGPLLPYIFDIVKFKGRDVSNDPYAAKYDMLKSIESAVPDLKVADTAFTAAQKRRLVTSIREGRHPDTKEGVVEWGLNEPSGRPAKLKFRDTHEVYVRNVFPAVDKAGNEKPEAGGFGFSWTPKGKVVGTVGTGFSRDKRIDMLKHPENYIGNVARVKSTQKYESGALRAPSFYSMHVEKNLEKQSEYDPPYGRYHPTVKTLPERLMADPVHRWRANTGIELIHKEPTKKELLRIIENWKQMNDKMKDRSEKKSIKLFGVNNMENAQNILDQIKKAAFLDELKKIATVEDPYENNGAVLETFESSDTNQASTGTSDSYYNPESNFFNPTGHDQNRFKTQNPFVNNFVQQEVMADEY
jgi:hypothetical protein